MLQDNVHLKYVCLGFLNPVTKTYKLLHQAEFPPFKENISFSSVLDMCETWFHGILVHAVNTVYIWSAVKTPSEKA